MFKGDDYNVPYKVNRAGRGDNLADRIISSIHRQGYSIYFFIAHYMIVQLQCFQYYIYYFVSAYKIVFK